MPKNKTTTLKGNSEFRELLFFIAPKDKMKAQKYAAEYYKLAFR
jgi:hypothetical protein